MIDAKTLNLVLIVLIGVILIWWLYSKDWGKWMKKMFGGTQYQILSLMAFADGNDQYIKIGYITDDAFEGKRNKTSRRELVPFKDPISNTELDTSKSGIQSSDIIPHPYVCKYCSPECYHGYDNMICASILFFFDTDIQGCEKLFHFVMNAEFGDYFTNEHYNSGYDVKKPTGQRLTRRYDEDPFKTEVRKLKVNRDVKGVWDILVDICIKAFVKFDDSSVKKLKEVTDYAAVNPSWIVGYGPPNPNTMKSKDLRDAIERDHPGEDRRLWYEALMCRYGTARNALGNYGLWPKHFKNLLNEIPAEKLSTMLTNYNDALDKKLVY